MASQPAPTRLWAQAVHNLGQLVTGDHELVFDAIELPEILGKSFGAQREARSRVDQLSEGSDELWQNMDLTARTSERAKTLMCL